jgi:SHS2 domain-containing protein
LPPGAGTAKLSRMGEAGGEHFEHGSDVGVRGFGPTRAAAFEQAALALTAAIAELDAVRAAAPVEIAVEAPDDERLLAAWLNALIFEMATRGMLFARFDVTIAGRTLDATAWGEPVERARHHPAVEVKGATLTQAAVYERNGEWTAQCVIDV